MAIARNQERTWPGRLHGHIGPSAKITQMHLEVAKGCEFKLSRWRRVRRFLLEGLQNTAESSCKPPGPLFEAAAASGIVAAGLRDRPCSNAAVDSKQETEAVCKVCDHGMPFEPCPLRLPVMLDP